MLSVEGDVLYVGKAKNLKNRVSSYFTKTLSSPKTKALVAQIVSIEVTVTKTETEALLLESSLIKQYRPKYNILLRDDKTYPFIHITSLESFPRIEIMRSKHKPQKGQFYGPYPNTYAAREALNLIQKVFQIRNCTDTYFKSRSRPCLQYQIKRCTAPCTKLITKEAYQELIKKTEQFLQGKSALLIETLEQDMHTASLKLEYEKAARIRDQIQNLRQAQEQQGVVFQKGDADVLAVDVNKGFACILWVMIRQGEIMESRSFFPALPEIDLEQDENIEERVLMAFIRYYYFEFQDKIPPLILTQVHLTDIDALSAGLSAFRGANVKILTKLKGVQQKWMDFALNNLRLSLESHQLKATTLKNRYEALEQVLGLTRPIERMECFDISHTQGTDTVASCVVFDKKGPAKRLYRRFNIQGITPGDDYAAMSQALTRRFKRLLINHDLPTLLIIDGGKGQVKKALEVMKNLGITTVDVIGIAKGVTRKAGLERIIFSTTGFEMTLPAHSEALHLLQHIRDESHRFAITGHREKRQKKVKQSELSEIEGVGPIRRKSLLTRFGSVSVLSKASIEDILRVKGINQSLAQKIYDHFHPDEPQI